MTTIKVVRCTVNVERDKSVAVWFYASATRGKYLREFLESSWTLYELALVWLCTFNDNRWEGNLDPVVNDDGLLSTVNVPRQIHEIKIRLVHSKSSASLNIFSDRCPCKKFTNQLPPSN